MTTVEAKDYAMGLAVDYLIVAEPQPPSIHRLYRGRGYWTYDIKQAERFDNRSRAERAKSMLVHNWLYYVVAHVK